MTIYSFSDVLLLPFPFSNQISTKKRPSVVISSNSYNQYKPDIIIIGITSQTNTPLTENELSIIKFSEAGLLKPSIIKPVIATIDKNLVIKKLGQLQKEDAHNLHHLMARILG
ncbi:type II toxin-antitoxin system PemK/MazF family toxin [Geminocystis herdmanii]|uniref:type II toxin-antitoxin system PemK/MazF family toxin n=1 Tax=Geminocystis herdmanii TaxID=669359 RepID=UPI0003457447|nr:type II toxin-antitoxin system PemK/MazF family toxin [Geminocystis herdmanii]